MTKGRYPKEHRQEDVSRAQFSERLHQYGWVCDPIERDTGEDLYVRIFDDGNWSGLTFMVQLKSRSSKTGRSGKSFIAQPVAVADLRHWEGSALPVFLVAWNVDDRQGPWVRVSDAIAELGQRRSKWRGQSTTTLRLASENTFDDVGFSRIRDMVARESVETIRRGRDLYFQTVFEFPKTAEGDAARKALEQHFATGEEIEVDGKFVKEVVFSDWWTRVFPDHMQGISQLKLGPAAPSEPQPVKIEMLPRSGKAAAIDYVELRQIRGGTQETTLTNEHQQLPLHFTFVFRRVQKKMSISVRLKGPGVNVGETLAVLRFLDALSAGGTLRISFLSLKHDMDTTVPGGTIRPAPRDLMEVVEQLATIQRKTGVELGIPADWELSDDDIGTARRVHGIVQHGRSHIPNGRFSFSITRNTIPGFLKECRPDGSIDFTLKSQESSADLLGKHISLGPIVQTVAARLKGSPRSLRRRAAKLNPDDVVEVRFVQAEVVQEYAKWMPAEAERAGEG